MRSLSFLPAILALVSATPVPTPSITTPTNVTLASRLAGPKFYSMPAKPIFDASAADGQKKTWQDPYGVVDHGSFSLVVEDAILSIWTQSGGDKPAAAGSFLMCSWGIPETILGHPDFKYTRSENLLQGKLYIHEGNQCRDPWRVTMGQAFDDVWVVWHNELINLPTDLRCGDVGAQGGIGHRARRCIIKKNTKKPGPPKPPAPPKKPVTDKPKPKSAPPSSPKPKPAECVPPLCIPKDSPKAPKEHGTPEKSHEPTNPKPPKSTQVSNGSKEPSNCVPPLCIPKGKAGAPKQ